MIIAGDFNSRVGKLTGDSKLDENGFKLLNSIQKHNLLMLNNIQHEGNATFHGSFRKCFNEIDEGMSIIDYFSS